MSAITITCPACQAHLRSARPVPAGANVRCRKCGKRFAVTPAAPAHPLAPLPSTADAAGPDAPWWESDAPGATVPRRQGPAPLLTRPQTLALFGSLAVLLVVGIVVAVTAGKSSRNELVAQGSGAAPAQAVSQEPPPRPARTDPAAAAALLADLGGKAEPAPGVTPTGPPTIKPPVPTPPLPTPPVAATPAPTPSAVEPPPTLGASKAIQLGPNFVTVLRPKPLSDNVTRGLKWLADKQQAGGGWADEEAGGRQGIPPTMFVPTRDKPTITDTSLATLALLRAGGAPGQGTYGSNIVRGVEFVCAAVEKSDKMSLAVTDLKRTIVQVKMGPHFDTFAAAWLLSEVSGRMPDEAGNRRVAAALAQVIDKMQRHQLADGTWVNAPPIPGLEGSAVAPKPRPIGRRRPPRGFFPPPRMPGPPPGFGGLNRPLVPLLGQAVAVKALNRARQAGAEVPERTLERALAYARAHFDRRASTFGQEGSFGIGLYAAAAHVGAMQDSLNTRLAGDGLAKTSLTDLVELREEAGVAVSKRLSDPRFLLQFGRYGGEDFLAYLLLSEAMAVKNDAKWKDWDKSMAGQLNRQQNRDGSWTGHHCTTGRTFCTAAVVLVLAADRSPVAKSMLKK